MKSLEKSTYNLLKNIRSKLNIEIFFSLFPALYFRNPLAGVAFS